MSVVKQERPAVARFARWLLGCAVRHWPEENRVWGLALAAEVDETANAFETVRWSLGGIMLFTRSVLSSAWAWMKLPAGSSLSGGANGPDGPSLLTKRSRVFTAVVLAAAAMLLILPEGREAIRTVRSSWRGYELSGSDARMLDELAARAEKEKDAGTLAFAALSTLDRTRGAAWTERAVALDPQFIWVYGARNHGPKMDPPKEEWLARLRAADPGNSVPELLTADALAQPRLAPLYEHGVKNEGPRQLLASDPTWMAMMERASAAPRYDSYFQRHYQLARTVWNRERNLPPTVVLYGMWQHALPNLLNIRTYSEIEIQEAQKARESGDSKRAKSLLGAVDAFGMRMADANGPEIEKLIGLAIARNANKEMAKHYQVPGGTEDAQRMAKRLEQIEGHVQEVRLTLNLSRNARAQAFRREAFFVQAFGTLGVIAVFAALAGILLLELWPGGMRNAKTIWWRAACWAADYAPATLLVACGAFLVSFLPFQSAFEEYRTSNFLLGDEQVLTDAMWSLFEIPSYVVGVDAAVEFWSFVTIALSALLLVVLSRGFYRLRRAAARPA
jgi:hypothetical protein